MKYANRADVADPGFAILPVPGGLVDSGVASAPRSRLIRRGPLVPLQHRDFALFWSGAFISNAGTWLQNATLSWLVLSITDSPFWTTMVTFSQFFPMMLFGLVGGLAADRLERRRVLLVTQSVMMGVAFALCAITFTGHASVATILPIVALGGIALSFNAPAFQAMIGDLVPRDVVLDAVALNTAQFSASRVVGPLLGGLMIASVGAGWAFFANGVTFIAVLAALLMIRPARQTPPASKGRRALLGGVRAMKEIPAIRTIIIITSVISLFAAPVIALLSVIARDVLHMGARGYGLLFAAFSIGAVAGALAMGKIVRRVGMFHTVTFGVAAISLCTLGVGMSRHAPVTSLLLAAVGFVYTVTVGATNTGIQLSVPASKRGRVMSLYMMSWAGLFPVGSVLAGAAATLIGSSATLMLAAAPLAVAATVLALRGDSLRAIRVR